MSFKIKKPNIFVRSILFQLTYIIFSVGLIFIMINSSYYRLEEFCSTVYANQDSSSSDRIYLRVERKDEKKGSLYNDLYLNFKNNKLVYGVQQVLTNYVTDDSGNQLNFLSQSTFTVFEDSAKSTGYRMDYDIFTPYFGNDLMGNRTYLSVRGNADSFIFISDRYADVLLQKYDISSYEQLITDQRYCYLDVIVDNNKTVKLSINNILSSSANNVSALTSRYEYFGLIYASRQASQWASFAFDFELKSNPWMISKVFNTLYTLDYDSINSNFSFYSYNSETRNFSYRNDLTNGYYDLWVYSNTKYLIYIYCAIFTIGTFLLLFQAFWLEENRKIYLLNFGLMICSCIVFSIAVSGIYVNAFIKFYPIISIILMFVYSYSVLAEEKNILVSKIKEKIKANKEKRGIKDENQVA